MDKLRKALVTGLGAGYLPVAPGTWGSAAVCVIFLAVALASGGGGLCTTVAMGLVAVLASVACVGLGRFAESAFGRKDPSQCTIDEWAGQALALMFLPMDSSLPLWQGYAIAAGVAFLAFRLFDIVKPSPARRLERLSCGWGVLLDDLVAGVYANIASQLFLRLVLKW